MLTLLFNFGFMETVFMEIKVEIQTKSEKRASVWEQSRAFQKFWKALNMPKAKFRSQSYSGGDSLDVNLQEEMTEEQTKLAKQLEYFFEAWSFNGMEDIYENKENNTNPFCFKYVMINELRA